MSGAKSFGGKEGQKDFHHARRGIKRKKKKKGGGTSAITNKWLLPGACYLASKTPHPLPAELDKSVQCTWEAHRSA